MKATSLISILALALLLIGCAAKQVPQQVESSPTVEAEEIGNELSDEDLNMEGLDELDQELDSFDSDLEEF